MKRSGWFFSMLLGLGMLAGLIACGSDDHINIFHANFTANGEHKDFTTTLGFFDLGGYAISYSADRNIPSPSTNYLQIDLPSNVKAGDVFTETSAGSLLLYYDAQGITYDSRNYSTMTITVTEWAGPGGYGRGTFIATLSDGFGHTAVLANGSFEGFIHNK